MLDLLRDLIAHKHHANALMLTAIRGHREAAADADIIHLLHHVLVANRFWFLTVCGQPFDSAKEMRAPESLDELIAAFDVTQREEALWITRASEADLARMLENRMIPGGRCTVAQGLVQVCMHSQGHRAQIAKMLRRHEVVPPMTDFILWVANKQVV